MITFSLNPKGYLVSVFHSVGVFYGYLVGVFHSVGIFYGYLVGVFYGFSLVGVFYGILVAFTTSFTSLSPRKVVYDWHGKNRTLSFGLSFHMLLKLLSLVVVFLSLCFFHNNPIFFAEPSFKTCKSLLMVSPRICIYCNDSANFTKTVLSNHNSFFSLSLLQYSNASLSVKSSAGLSLLASSIYGSFPGLSLYALFPSSSGSSLYALFPSSPGSSLLALFLGSSPYAFSMGSSFYALSFPSLLIFAEFSRNKHSILGYLRSVYRRYLRSVYYRYLRSVYCCHPRSVYYLRSVYCLIFVLLSLCLFSDNSSSSESHEKVKDVDSLKRVNGEELSMSEDKKEEKTKDLESKQDNEIRDVNGEWMGRDKEGLKDEKEDKKERNFLLSNRFDNELPVLSLRSMVKEGKLHYDYSIYWSKSLSLMRDHYPVNIKQKSSNTKGKNLLNHKLNRMSRKSKKNYLFIESYNDYNKVYDKILKKGNLFCLDSIYFCFIRLELDLVLIKKILHYFKGKVRGYECLLLRGNDRYNKGKSTNLNKLNYFKEIFIQLEKDFNIFENRMKNKVLYIITIECEYLIRKCHNENHWLWNKYQRIINKVKKEIKENHNPLMNKISLIIARFSSLIEEVEASEGIKRYKASNTRKQHTSDSDDSKDNPSSVNPSGIVPASLVPSVNSPGIVPASLVPSDPANPTTPGMLTSVKDKETSGEGKENPIGDKETSSEGKKNPVGEAPSKGKETLVKDNSITPGKINPDKETSGKENPINPGKESPGSENSFEKVMNKRSR